jgi:hypothetical protein
MQLLLQEINQGDPPPDMPDLEQTFFQGLHDNIKSKIINELTVGARRTWVKTFEDTTT